MHSHPTLAEPSVANGLVTVCCYSSCLALLFYDYLLTLGREIEYIWAGQFSLPSMLFYIVRYSAIINTICMLAEMYPWSGLNEHSCSVYTAIDMLTTVLLLIGTALFAAMRVYALFARRLCILLMISTLGLVAPAISLYTFTHTVTVYSSNSCGFTVHIANAAYQRLMIIARASSIAAEALVLALTCTRVINTDRTGSWQTPKSPLKATLISDGAAYFLILFIINVTGLAVGELLQYTIEIPTWIAILASILTCRFMLHLRHLADTNDDSNWTSCSESDLSHRTEASLQFAAFVSMKTVEDGQEECYECYAP